MTSGAAFWFSRLRGPLVSARLGGPGRRGETPDATDPLADSENQGPGGRTPPRLTPPPPPADSDTRAAPAGPPGTGKEEESPPDARGVGEPNRDGPGPGRPPPRTRSPPGGASDRGGPGPGRRSPPGRSPGERGTSAVRGWPGPGRRTSPPPRRSRRETSEVRPCKPTKGWIWGLLSMDRSDGAALPRTKPRPRIRSSTSHLAPGCSTNLRCVSGSGDGALSAAPDSGLERLSSPEPKLRLSGPNLIPAALRYRRL